MIIKAKHIMMLSAMLIFVCYVYSQSSSDSTRKDTTIKKKYQAKAPPTQPFSAEAFRPSNETTVRWLGMAGFLVNSRGTTFMIDPLLEGYDMPLLMKFQFCRKMSRIMLVKQ